MYNKLARVENSFNTSASERVEMILPCSVEYLEQIKDDLWLREIQQVIVALQQFVVVFELVTFEQQPQWIMWPGMGLYLPLKSSSSSRLLCSMVPMAPSMTMIRLLSSAANSAPTPSSRSKRNQPQVTCTSL